MTEDTILLNTLRTSPGALCTSCLEELTRIRDRRAHVILERLSEAGLVTRTEGTCGGCQLVRTISRANQVTRNESVPARTATRQKAEKASQVVAGGMPEKPSVAGSRITIDVGGHPVKITRTRQEWQLGFHCAGFPTRDEVYRYFRPLTTAGWRISNVFESTERGYDWYVHVRKPGEGVSLNPSELGDTLREAFGAERAVVDKVGRRQVGPYVAPTHAERVGGMRKPLAQRLQDVMAKEVLVEPVVAPSPGRPGESGLGIQKTTSPMEWQDLLGVWSDLLSRRVTPAGLMTLLEEQSRVTTLLQALQGEADWAIGRALLRHESPDALDLLASSPVQDRLKEHPEDLWQAIRLASRERRPEMVAALRRLSPIQAPGDIYIVAARAYFELGKMKESLQQFHLAEHDPAYRMTGDDLGRKAQTLFKAQRYEDCLAVSRKAIELGSIPLEMVYELAAGNDLPDTDRIDLVTLAWERAHNIDQARELEMSLLTATELLVKQRPQVLPAIMRNLSSWVELLLAGDEPHRVWEVLAWVQQQKLPLGCIVGVLDSIASTYPVQTLSELEGILTVHLNRMLGAKGETLDADSLSWGRDLLISLHGDETLAGLLAPPEPTLSPSAAQVVTRYPNVKVVLVGASQSVRSQVRDALKKQYGITAVSEVPPHWEGTIDTKRLRDLVSSHDLVVVSAAMMDHSLWYQVGKDRTKFLYPPAGGASGTIRTIGERLAGTG